MSINPFLTSQNVEANKLSLRKITLSKDLPPLAPLGFKIPEVKSLDFIPLSEEEIEKFSLLSKLKQQKLPIFEREDTYLKFAANFLGGGLITGGAEETQLDGFQWDPNLEMWKWMTEDLRTSVERGSQEQKVVNNLITGIKQLQQFDQDIATLKENKNDFNKLKNTSMKYAKKIAALKPGESQAILGGWSNRGGGVGHAEIYEFTRREDHKYNIYIYTSTGHALTENSFFDERLRMKPVILFKAVPENKLLLNSDKIIRPTIIQRMIELHVFPVWDNDLGLTSEDALSVFDPIRSYQSEVKYQDFGGIIGQRGGTCVPSVMKVWIRRHCLQLDFYKQAMYQFKLRFLIGIYPHLQKNLTENSRVGEQSRRLLKMAARQVLRRTAKAHPILETESAQQAIATAYDVIERVNGLEGKIKIYREGIRFGSTPNKIAFDKQVEGRSDSEMEFHHPNTGRNFHSSPFPPFNLSVAVNGIEDTLNEAFIGLWRCSYSAASAFISHITDQFPIPSVPANYDRSKFLIDQISNSAWDDVKDPLECLKQLEKLAEAYTKCSKHELFSRASTTMLTLHATIHYLALKIDSRKEHPTPESRLDQYKPHLSWNEINKMKAVLYFNKKEHEKTVQALKYFSFFTENAPKDALFTNGEETLVVKTVVSGSLMNGRYWEALLNSDEKLNKCVSDEGNKRWRDKTDEEIDTNYEKALKRYKDALNEKYSYYTPTRPEREVNLPSITKNVMILEESFGSNKAKNPLAQSGYEHINIIRRMTLSAEDWVADGKVSYDVRADATWMKPYHGYEGRVKAKTAYSDWATQKELNNTILKNEHRPLTDQHSNLLIHNGVAARGEIPFRGQEEGSLLRKKIYRRSSDELSIRLLRTLSEWKLAPYQLIHEISKDLDVLSDPSMQTLFNILFFRSPIENETPLLGAGEILTIDGALYDTCKIFIQKGLNHFEGGKNGLKGGQFFIEFAYYLSKYLVEDEQPEKAAGLFDIETINRFLKRDNNSDQETGQLHQYRALFLLLDNDDKHLADIYESWFMFKLAPNNTEWTSNTITQFLKRGILKLTEKIYREEYEMHFLTDVLRRLGFINTPDDWKWEVDGSRFDGKSSSGSELTVDLAEAKIKTSTGLVSGMDDRIGWEDSAAFERLFGDENGYTYRKEGKCVTFHHPTIGKVRIVNQYREYYFQRQFPNTGELWFQYSGRSSTIMSKDHVLWEAPISSGEFISYYTTLKSQKRKFGVTEKHEIFEVNPEDGTRLKGARELYIADSTNAVVGLTKFDQSNNILLFRNTMTKSVEEVKFPRYTSIEGNPLTFVKHQEEIVWTENRQYILPKEIPMGYLGKFSNYLYLVSKNSNTPDKVLVPHQDLDEKHYGRGRYELDTECDEPPFDDVEDVEQWGRFKYFVYNVQGDALSATSLEGQFHLAYLHFAQMEYGKAAQLLRKIKPTETLSPLCRRILELIIDFKVNEDHPNGSAIILLAAHTYIRELDSISLEEMDDHLDDLTKDVVASAVKYIQMLNNVDHACRLTHCEESSLLPKILLQEEASKAPFTSIRTIARRIKTLSGNPVGTLKLQPADRKKPFKGQTTAFRSSLPYIDKKPPEFTEKPPKDMLYHSAYRNRLWEHKDKENKYKRGVKKARDWIHSGVDFDRCITPEKGSSYDHKSDGRLVIEAIKRVQSENRDSIKEMVIRLLSWSKSDGVSITRNALCILARSKSNPGYLKDLKIPDAKHATDDEICLFIDNLKYELWRSVSFQEIYKTFFKEDVKSTHSEIVSGNYPIKNGLLFDKPVTLPSKINPAEIPLYIQSEDDDTRWDCLTQWEKRYIQETKNTSGMKEKDFNFNFDDSLVSKGEEGLAEAFKKDLFDLKQEYEAGKKQNEMIPNYSLIGETETFKSEVSSRLDKVKEKRATLEKNLIEKINVRSSDVVEQANEIARLGGGVDAPLHFGDCIQTLLCFDQRQYTLKNKNLSDSDEINSIASMTLEVQDLKSEQAQLSRICTLIDKIEAHQNLKDPTRTYLCHKLATELHSRYHFEDFSSEIQSILRVFSGETGLIPYKKQVVLIQKMLETEQSDPARFRDIVIQLIMGGGKTSVLATILLYITAKRKDRLGLFIVPASLYETVKTNFSEATKKAFHTDVLTFDLNRAQMTVYRLKQTLEAIERARSEGLPIIVKSNSIQNIELEFLSQARNIKKYHKDMRTKTGECDRLKKQRDKIQNRIKSLDRNSVGFKKGERESRQINSLIKQKKNQISQINKHVDGLKERLKALHSVAKIFPECGDALLDEVDLLLDCLQEVNFPDGDTIPVKPVRNLLLHTIFNIMVSDQLSEVIKLDQNKQSLLSKEIFKKHVTPVIVGEICRTFKPISDFVEGFSDAFLQYVTGEIEENDPFLAFINQLYKSGDEKQEEAANLIALTKHLVSELIPATLRKSGRRHYGPIEGNQVGKIVPYLAVNIPATTQFGYHWEEACYNYQWAAAFPVSGEVVANLAKEISVTARYYAQKNGERFDETAEFNFFKRIFGVRLDQISDPEILSKAVSNVSKDIKKKLDLQFEIVARNVNFRSERLSSNGISLMDQLNSRRTMSGTPWNVEGYTPSLAKRFEKDEGTEGRILHKIAQRARDSKIHEVKFTTIEQFMIQVLSKHKNPQKIRGIIEAGGLFKIFKSNAEVAEQLIHYIKDKQKDLVNPKIKGVLFFHNDPGQIQPDTLYVWKLDDKEPERVGGSSVATLQAKGLTPENYFVYYDERHTTGQDILQVPDAINLFTFDEKMIRRTIGQGKMRLRQFLFSQDTEIVVSTETRKILLNEGKSMEDFILSSEKVQSMRKTRDMVRYFRQQIDNIFRAEGVKAIFRAFEADDKINGDFETAVTEYEPFFVATLADEPYLIHGSIKPMIKTKALLKRYLKSKMERFINGVSDIPAIQSAQEKSKEMIKYINEATCLPKFWEDNRNPIGLEQEVAVEQEVMVEVEVETELEIEIEVELELQRYEGVKSNTLRTERKISEKQFIKLIDAVREETTDDTGIISLRSQLDAYKYGFQQKQHDYGSLFAQEIYGTKAFFYTCIGESFLPVFHPLQRPAKQILAIKSEGEMKWLLLSEFEANVARDHLKNLYAKNNDSVNDVWLIQPDGSMLISSDNYEEFPIDEEFVEDGLLEINAFDGNVRYLDKNASETEVWLSKDPELKIHYLKLRTARNPRLNEILRRCPTIMKLDKGAAHNPNFQMIQERMDKEKSRQGKFIPLTSLDAKMLSPKKVRNLNVQYVQYLGIDTENPDELSKKAIEKLGLDKAKKLTARQFMNLREFHGPFIQPEQLKWLPPIKTTLLEKPEQIFKEGEYFLSKEQVGHLQEHQRALIPFVNPEFISEFNDKWQIQAVSPEHIHRIDEKHWIHFTKNQVKAIPAEKSAFISKLARPEMFGWVHGNLIESIPEKFDGMICQEQIQEITDVTLIPKLGRLTLWITAEMVPHIDFSKQLQLLSAKEQIHAVPNEWVCKLDCDKQVPLITRFQVPSLSGISQIQACPNGLVSCLSSAQINNISDRQTPYLQGKEQIQSVTEPALIKKLIAITSQKDNFVNQMQWISSEQLKEITPAQVRGLSQAQILELKQRKNNDEWKQFGAELTEQQIKKFASHELIDLLTAEQITAHLTKEQVKFLKSESQIQACPAEHTKFLKKSQLKHISTKQVPGLVKEQLEKLKLLKDEWKPYREQITKEQIISFTHSRFLKLISLQQITDHLTKGQVSLLNTPEMIKACPNRLVPCLTAVQVPNVSEAQIPYLLGERQVQAVKEGVMIKKLVAVASQEDGFVNQMPWISLDQLKEITPDQVQGLSQAQLLKLKPLKSDDDWKQFGSKITQDQIKTFDTVESFDLLSAEQIKYLTLKQIGMIKTKETIDKLDVTQYQNLNIEALALLAKDNIDKIVANEATHDLIQKLQTNQFTLITNQNAFKKVKEAQLSGMNDDEVNALDENHPIWEKKSVSVCEKVDENKVHLIANDMLKHVEKQEAIRKISFWRVQHLPKEKLRQRSRTQFFTYIIGVVTLGIVSSIIALVAHLTLIPLIIYLANKKKGKKIIAKLHANPKRLFNLFKVYLTKN